MTDARFELARHIALIMTVSSRALDQALDMSEPDLTVKDILNYTETIRRLVNNLNAAVGE